ncbi:MAG TPA: 4Fe-4S dicluster domain-containing protein, partial [Bdellovibrionota bacterium]|nr:4Fe-4S dicluster domain-containing protein [Bdellovibrionota bacterium]
ASTWPGVYGGHGILVKTREGRPIKLEPNPEHPVNGSGLCAQAQAAILTMYDPDRLTGPVAVSGGSTNNVSWADLDKAVGGKLRSGGKVRILTGGVSSPSTRKLIKEFLGGVSDGKHVQWEPSISPALLAAQEESYGEAKLPVYRFDRADLVVTFGSDFLGASPDQAANMALWGKKRDLRGQKAQGARMSRMIAFEPTVTLTGANADERYAVDAGDELKVALAIAHELTVGMQQTKLAGDAPTREALRDFSPAKVAQDVGGKVTEELIKKVAKELWENRGRSLVIGGDLLSSGADGLKLQLAINLLNSALENDGVTVDFSAHAENAGLMSGWKDFRALVQDMNSGSVDVLIIQGVNPVYHLGKATGFAAALGKVKMAVRVADRVDETGAACHFVAPEHHFLENWGDHEPRAGLLSLQQPTIHPLHDTRGFQDMLLAWAGKKGTWHEYLQDSWKLVHSTHGRGQGFEEFWMDSLQKGVVGAASAKESAGRHFRTYSLRSLMSGRAAKSEGLKLALYRKVSLGDGAGAQANNGWLQEMPDPVTTVTWDNHFNVAPALAQKMKLVQNDVVRVTTEDGSALELPVLVQPGMPENTVSVAVGYGRTRVGSVGTGVGGDANAFVKTDADGIPIFSGQKIKMEKLGWRYELALTQGHHRTMDRPIVNDITLNEYRKEPGAEMHTNPELRPKEVATIWPLHEYTGYRWGMSVDQTACTGCGACVIACQAENNIPIVGRARVRVSREMQWIRIDRYYSGSDDAPDLVFQPMMCQHCENAPCETVCPVLATSHTDEGLNDMTYNRCVGTRYCQNNCPYKVRRFNFFDHWKDYRGTINLAWNPDVTVRTRGVMEKCTFCIQRINEGKVKARVEGRKVQDGEIQTACMQTCPTDAIVFGDVNDPTSRVSKLRAEARGFKAIEEMNTKPSITYLSKVRNKEQGATEHV